MSEESVILKTEKPITVNDIYGDLVNLGIKQNDNLLVHSSLSSIGWVCGGPQAVILGLTKALSEGTLIMPAHSGDWSDPAKWINPPVPKEWISIIYENSPVFDKNVTPTRGMGRIAELFRTFPNTERSEHPLVSFAAHGINAKDICEHHPLTPSLGLDSPLGRLYHLDGKVLLLGVGFDSCTSFHLSEAMITEMPKEKQGAALSINGVRVWKWYEDIQYDSDDFDSIGKDFIKTNNVTVGNVGNASCYLFNIKTGVDFAREWIKKHRFSD